MITIRRFHSVFVSLIASSLLVCVASRSVTATPEHAKNDPTGARNAVLSVMNAFDRIDEDNAYSEIHRLLETVEEAGPFALPALERYAFGKSRFETRVAIVALGRLEGRDAGPLLERLANRHPDFESQCLAALSLGSNRCRSAAPSLMAILERDERAGYPTPRAMLRQNAAMSLGRLDDADAVPILLRILQKDRTSRSAALVGLAGLARHLDLDSLTALASSKDAGLRKAAALLIGTLEDSSREQALRKLSADRSYEVRIGAALSLGRFDDADTVARSLKSSLADRHPAVRESAELALRALRAPNGKEGEPVREQLHGAWFYELSQPLVETRVLSMAGKSRGAGRGTGAGSVTGSRGGPAPGANQARPESRAPASSGSGSGGNSGGAGTGQGGHGGSYRGPAGEAPPPGGEGGGSGGGTTPAGDSGSDSGAGAAGSGPADGGRIDPGADPVRGPGPDRNRAERDTAQALDELLERLILRDYTG